MATGSLRPIRLQWKANSTQTAAPRQAQTSRQGATRYKWSTKKKELRELNTTTAPKRARRRWAGHAEDEASVKLRAAPDVFHPLGCDLTDIDGSSGRVTEAVEPVAIAEGMVGDWMGGAVELAAD